MNMELRPLLGQSAEQDTICVELSFVSIGKAGRCSAAQHEASLCRSMKRAVTHQYSGGGWSGWLSLGGIVIREHWPCAESS